MAETDIYADGETDHSGGKNRKYREIEFGQTIDSIVYPNYRFLRANLEDKAAIEALFSSIQFDLVIHLAAQAGVRYSIGNPDAYIQSNIVGFLNILEACRNHQVKHLLYASSSSVYGENAKVPFSEDDRVDHPVSLYAPTKKSNELMAHTYSHLYGIKTTGLRFFTVYGPWGRPDMAPILFANAISKNQPIKVFNNSDMERDFTYIDDIIEGIVRLAQSMDEGKEYPDSRFLNIGNGKPVNLLAFIETLENSFGKKVEKIMTPMQDGDVPRTWADTHQLTAVTGYVPKVELEEGIGNFCGWYQRFYN